MPKNIFVTIFLITNKFFEFTKQLFQLIVLNNYINKASKPLVAISFLRISTITTSYLNEKTEK